MVASIILLVIAHRLPQMVAGMVVGGGHNGAVGSVGIMALLGTGVAMTSMAGSAAAAARTAGVSQAAVDANQRLLDRIALLGEANAAGNGNGNDAIHNSTRPDTNTPDSGLRQGRNPTSPDTVASSARRDYDSKHISRHGFARGKKRRQAQLRLLRLRPKNRMNRR